MAHSEFEERVARLNTQLRFGRPKPALVEAYKLRLFIQLHCTHSPDALEELKRVERVIGELEGKQLGAIQKLVNKIVKTAKASLNPTEGKEETLLDKFREPIDPITSEDEETSDEEADSSEAE